MRFGGASFTLHVRSAMEAMGPASEQAESWLATLRVSSDAASLVSLRSKSSSQTACLRIRELETTPR